METEFEVVSVQSVSADKIRVGLAPIGRISEFTQRAADPASRHTVPADQSVEWNAADQPRVGEVITASFSRKVQ